MQSILDQYTGKKVLITGGGGFIGSHVAQLLSGAQNISLIVTVRPSVSPWRLEPTQESIDIVEIDVCQQNEVDALIQSTKPDIIFHVAAALDRTQSLDVLDTVVQTNVGMTKQLLEAAKKYEVEKFVYIGTIEEYGLGETPFRETAHEQPLSPYSLSKVISSQYTLLYHHLSTMNTCVIRPAATYGPKQGQNMLIPVFIKACLDKQDFSMNPGEQIKNYIYVEDLVDGIARAGISQAADGQIINLGHSTHYTIKDVVNTINEKMGKPISITFGAHSYRPLDPMQFIMDSAKAKKLFGWEANTSLEEGLEKTIDWYTKQQTV